MKRKLLAILTGGLYDGHHLREELRQYMLHRKKAQGKMK